MWWWSGALDLALKSVSLILSMMNRQIGLILVAGMACVANGQQHKRITNSVVEPLDRAPQADLVDLRMANEPLVRQEEGLKTGRELRQGQPVVTTVRPKAKGLADDLGTRQEKANLRLQQDRAKVKREAAVDAAE